MLLRTKVNYFLRDCYHTSLRNHVFDLSNRIGKLRWRSLGKTVNSSNIDSYFNGVGGVLSLTKATKNNRCIVTRTSTNYRNTQNVDGVPPKKVLLYSCVNDTFGRNYTMTMLNYNILLIAIVYSCYKKLHGRVKEEPEDKTVIWWRNRNMEIMLAILLLFDCILLTFWKRFPSLSVKQLWLDSVRGKQYFEITTHSSGLQNQSVRVPLDYVSTIIGRKNRVCPAILRLKGRSKLLLLHKTDATFHQPNLFDSCVPVNRTFGTGMKK